MQHDNNVRRAGLGQGWEQPAAKAPETKAVRIRTGTHLVTGRMIGDTQQPRAFVWIDEAANDLQKEAVQKLLDAIANPGGMAWYRVGQAISKIANIF